jgi:putative membrane protein insertion efficiency factor
MPVEPTAPPALSPGQRAALALLRVYKGLFSPLFAGSCRFVPSCSEYAADAVREHGVLRGTLLAARRLGRCHPFGGHGLDLVPERRPRA